VKLDEQIRRFRKVFDKIESTSKCTKKNLAKAVYFATYFDKKNTDFNNYYLS
jgi:hypothetical protein